MGLLTVCTSNLISLNAGGLEKTLEQILEALHKQDATLQKQEEVLQAQSERLDGLDDGIEVLQAQSDTLDGSEGTSVARRHGQSVASNTAAEGLEASVAELTRRLTLSEQSQAQQAGRADLEKRLDEERCNRESLEQSVRSLEASCRQAQEATLSVGNGFNGELQELRDGLFEELRRRCQAFEARVGLAEQKASECRREAKAYRDTVDEREFSASEVQKTLRTIESSTKQAIESSGQVVDAQKETSLLSRNFESQFQELETRLEQQVNDSVVDAMRGDLEMNGRVLQDAVKAVGHRLSEQEDRLRTLESTRQRNNSVDQRRHIVQDAREREQNAWRDGAREREDSSHCLLCSNDRSMSPTMVLIGTDNTVYGHADSLPEYPNEPPLLAGLRASQNVARPPHTAPSIPSMRQGPPQVVLSSSWEALPVRTAGTAASTSSIQKGGVRRAGRDVRSKRIGDLVAVYPKVEPDSRTSSRPSTATLSKTQTPSTRPSSAQSQGERGRRGIRPSSAGAYRVSPASETLSTSSPSAGDLMLVASQSLPMLEKRSIGVEAL